MKESMNHSVTAPKRDAFWWLGIVVFAAVIVVAIADPWPSAAAMGGLGLGVLLTVPWAYNLGWRARHGR